MNGLWVPAARSMAEASSSSECPATSARAKPAFKHRSKEAGRPGNHAVSDPNEQRQQRRRADRTRDQSQNQLRVDIETDVVLESGSAAQAGHRLEERLPPAAPCRPGRAPSRSRRPAACTDA